ncbi:hypothetical protein AM493_08300 [Flavobacterium akiainvivens]|uniref:Uncharacterized protein n=1 Tax=Flavobacterium akiainvivens TaxID=1202724 RepID=A0A0M9VHY2_9FLAO|nr:hypothetical protein [Flavobacterium akiainvivens]KOS06039.1 hypothetical protein AM493_08300 [Flavobacterium akiainvivens]SFQ54441.1 hypothetical protein SAMN05444144_107142 [Flavobacterium akiainvivens]
MENYDGIWLEVKEPSDYGSPTFITFEEGIIACHKLDEEDGYVKRLIRQDYVKQQPISLDFVADDRLRITEVGKHVTFLKDSYTTKDVTVRKDYLKLLPTKTDLTDSDIGSLKYTIVWNGHKINVVFNIILEEKPYIQEVNNRLGHKGREIKLFRLNETLLLCFFDNDYLDNIFPIVEIDEEAISICGFPAEPFSASGIVI